MDAPLIRLVDNIPLLEVVLDELSSPEVTKLALDLEGVDLCRNGRVSLVQIFTNVANSAIWIIDVTTLGSTAFSHVGSSGQSLKTILENGTTTKILYDVRSDSDALYNLYSVTLNNVYDLQLLEVAVRRSKGMRVKFVMGLGRAIEEHVQPQKEWKMVKEAGSALLFPDKGGSYEVFERRPLDERVILYAAQDVQLLFQLEAILEAKFGRLGSTSSWRARIAMASSSRVNEARGPTYINGQVRAIAPTF